MKKILLILSAVFLSGTAYIVAQDPAPDRQPPQGARDGGGRRGGGAMFRNSPLLKALKANEETGEISIADIEKDEKLGKMTLVAFLKSLDKAPEGASEEDAKKGGDGKIDRTELFGNFGGRGGAGAGGRRGADGAGAPGAPGGRPQRPARPASE